MVKSVETQVGMVKGSKTTVRAIIQSVRALVIKYSEKNYFIWANQPQTPLSESSDKRRSIPQTRKKNKQITCRFLKKVFPAQKIL